MIHDGEWRMGWQIKMNQSKTKLAIGRPKFRCGKSCFQFFGIGLFIPCNTISQLSRKASSICVPRREEGGGKEMERERKNRRGSGIHRRRHKVRQTLLELLNFKNWTRERAEAAKKVYGTFVTEVMKYSWRKMQRKTLGTTINETRMEEGQTFFGGIQYDLYCSWTKPGPIIVIRVEILPAEKQRT